MNKIPVIRGGQGRTAAELADNPITKACSLGAFKLVTIGLVLCALALGAQVLSNHMKGPTNVRPTQAR